MHLNFPYSEWGNCVTSVCHLWRGKRPPHELKLLSFCGDPSGRKDANYRISLGSSLSIFKCNKFKICSYNSDMQASNFISLQVNLSHSWDLSCVAGLIIWLFKDNSPSGFLSFIRLCQCLLSKYSSFQSIFFLFLSLLNLGTGIPLLTNTASWLSFTTLGEEPAALWPFLASSEGSQLPVMCVSSSAPAGPSMSVELTFVLNTEGAQWSLPTGFPIHMGLRLCCQSSVQFSSVS